MTKAQSGELARSGIRGSVVTVAAQALSVVFRLAGLVVLARLLEPSLFGLAAIAVAISTFASAIIFLGLPMATAQAPKLSNAAQSTLFWINTVLGIILCIAIASTADFVANIYSSSDLGYILKWIALVPLISGIQSQFRLRLVRELRFGVLASADVAAQVASTILSIALAYLGYALWAIISQGLTVVVVQLLVVGVSARWVPKKLGDWNTQVRGILIVGLRIFGINVLRDGSRSALVPLMGLQFSPTSLGNFDRAQQIAVVPVSLTVDQLQRVVVPILARLKGNIESISSFYRAGQLCVVYMTGSLFAILAAASPTLVELLLGREWSQAGTALQALSVGAAVRALAQTTQWVFIGVGQTAASLKLNMFLQPAVLAISLCGIPWGVVGVAWANSAAWLMAWPLSTWVLSRAVGLPFKSILQDAARGLFFLVIPVGLFGLLVDSFSRALGLSNIGVLSATILSSVLLGSMLVLTVPIVRQDFLRIYSLFRLALRKSPV
ncbi:oligosaccharide flippase family protein [Rhodococcus sp. H29-C3]|uniref:oligosaccharide flippase family protein n=1 Tax=Rhodococcus sp. H29-C3 TaxID=3046307 RepID=UPI0024B90B99|nr:oligosaccharide flippase family protein [Rhodococcus sp. H29-C3]MDJ0362569.1 oligosaccharide flippase family protein [Rhodococcus sp. H29-C3]